MNASKLHAQEMCNSTLETRARNCRETVILGILSHDKMEARYAAVIEGTHPLRFSATVGSVHPFYHSAIGLVLLAHMPEKEQKAYLKKVKFERRASKTISSATELTQRFESIRKIGVAVSANAMVDGVYSVAAPIFDARCRA